MLYFISVIVAAYLGSSTAARTEPEPDRVCFSTAETREKILAQGLFEPFRVMRNVASRSQAEAIGVKLCRWSEDLVVFAATAASFTFSSTPRPNRSSVRKTNIEFFVLKKTAAFQPLNRRGE